MRVRSRDTSQKIKDEMREDMEEGTEGKWGGEKREEIKKKKGEKK